MDRSRLDSLLLRVDSVLGVVQGGESGLSRLHPRSSVAASAVAEGFEGKVDEESGDRRNRRRGAWTAADRSRSERATAEFGGAFGTPPWRTRPEVSDAEVPICIGDGAPPGCSAVRPPA